MLILVTGGHAEGGATLVYSIYTDTNFSEVKCPYIFQERFDRHAQCDAVKKIIYLATVDGNGEKKAKSHILVSFIHEVLHAIDIQSGHSTFAGDEGENKIEGLSEGIYQVLVDNGFLKEEQDESEEKNLSWVTSQIENQDYKDPQKEFNERVKES